MGVSSQTTPLYCPSCSRHFRAALSSLSLFTPSQSPHPRRKIQAILIANNILQRSALSFRKGYSCIKRTPFELNKFKDVVYSHKSPVHISVKKFSDMSYGMLEERRCEEELSPLHPSNSQVKIMGLARFPTNPCTQYWVQECYKLSNSKKEMHLQNEFRVAPNAVTSTGQEQAVSRNVKHTHVQQDLDERPLPSVKHSKLKNSKELLDTKRVDTVLKVLPSKILKEKVDRVKDKSNLETIAKDEASATSVKRAPNSEQLILRGRLCSIYKDILVVNNISLAEEVAKMLTVNYRHLIHACDTEVARIDVKQETPVDHGEIICFSIYSGPEADFGGGKSCIWVDVLDGGGKEIFNKFAEFFQDSSIKKVWHNYSFDCHVIQNYGFKVSGFHADTMHMARLWDSSRRWVGGYSLEGLTGDREVMSRAKLDHEKDLIGKVSMKTIFGQKKVKIDGCEGKMTTIAPVDVLQRDERIPWICYSVLDARSTLKLYESLKSHLSDMPWNLDSVPVLHKNMYDFYQEYWQPFGELLVKMESEGMLVDRLYLKGIEDVAKGEQEAAVNRFRKWASRYCPDAKYMNVGSDAQLRVLLFGGTINRKNHDDVIPTERIFKIPNVDKVIAEGKKVPTKFRDIKLNSIGYSLNVEMYTPSGWPSVSGDALKVLAGKVSAEYDFNEACDVDLDVEDGNPSQSEVLPEEIDKSAYGTAFSCFPTEEEGKEACHAIAALCEVCSIDSLISNFILPLQGHNISGKDERIHCSININTETGRLSARRPNLQNQPALEKDRYKIRQAFIAAPGNSLIVADYGQLELRILAHLADCKSMLEAFEAGGDFHSRTAMNMYPYIREAVKRKEVLLEWHPQPGEDKPPVPLLKDAFASERRKAKMLNFSIAYGKTPVGLSRDWKVSVKEARRTVDLWYNDRKEVLKWQEERKKEAYEFQRVHTLLGRARRFPEIDPDHSYHRGHIERAAINTPVQGSAADVAMCAMLQISKNKKLKELGWKLLLQVHDEVILEGPTESAEVAKAIVVECMEKPFNGKNFLKVGLSVDAKCAKNWYAAK
ncbi:DNA polymerase I B, chloroplastic/mitochondrial-like [Vigna unguiculata]|uniref:DNA polymerase I B, chloroplastic/mitochondrial-like n=1 Tax=Vigna unguiculata TaxID=3917 RepID=UPI0010166A15|nr:DNA polymerase I B, chloroplastic/mitochondrial-like [Vigna unguiculata]